MRRSSTRPSAPACRCCSAAAVCPKETYPPADPLQFCTTRSRSSYRQPRGARPSSRRPRKEPVQARLFRNGDPDLARRDRIRREAGQDAGHDGGRQGDHPAADRRLHAVRNQDQGCRRELGVLLGALGDAGAHASRRCGGSAGRATTSPGRISKPRTSWSASRTQVLRDSAPMRCSRTTCRSSSEIARRRQEGERRNIRPSRWPKAGSPEWSSRRC